MQITWLTDIHLNFIDLAEREQFYQKIINTACEGVFITGDIAEAPSIVDIMNEMVHFIQKPIYFVLGNHDYYKGDVKQVRESMIKLTSTNKQLFWLPASGIQWLNDSTIILGQDGWADGRFGDYQHSTVRLNDSRLINDLFQASLQGNDMLLKKMQNLADIDAKNLSDNLTQATAKQPQKIIILTHIPPFKESCMHLGQASDDNWLPYFSSKATGNVILQVASQNPQIEFLVLCGHTHSKSYYQATDNLLIKAGVAEYYQPEIQEVIEILKN